MKSQVSCRAAQVDVPTTYAGYISIAYRTTEVSQRRVIYTDTACK